MTRAPEADLTVQTHAFALVADITGDPGHCAVYRLVRLFPAGALAVRHGLPEDADPVALPLASIITRSNRVEQVIELKTMLDAAWDSATEALHTYKAQIEPAVNRHGEAVQATQNDAMRHFGVAVTFDTQRAVDSLMAHARAKRDGTWASVVSLLAQIPLLPDKA